MHQSKILLSLALVMMLTGPGASAADAEHHQNDPGAAPPAAAANRPAGMRAGMSGGNAGNMPTMGTMQMMMGENVMAAHIERRIAFLKAELNITTAQQSMWNAVAEAIRMNAKVLAEISPAITGGSGTLPERLAVREKEVSAHLDAIRRLRTTFDSLYAAFNPGQQKIADGLMIDPRSVLGMGMM
jgi:hypothetical protein